MQRRLPAGHRAVYHITRAGLSAIAPMRPHELLTAASPAPISADEYGSAIRTLYAEQDRYHDVHKKVLFKEEVENERKDPPQYQPDCIKLRAPSPHRFWCSLLLPLIKNTLINNTAANIKQYFIIPPAKSNLFKSNKRAFRYAAPAALWAISHPRLVQGRPVYFDNTELMAIFAVRR